MGEAKYSLFGGKLYNRSYLGHLVMCLGPKAILKVMAENHDGIYGSHIRGKAMARRILVNSHQ